MNVKNPPAVLPAQDPWKRLPGETALAYAWFVKYREMADPARKIGRSIIRLASDHGRKPESLYEWSRRWRWQDRVVAWDEYADEESRQAQLAAMRKAGETRALVVLHGLEAIYARLAGRDGIIDAETGEIVRDKVQALDPNRLDAKDLAALGQMLGKMEAMAEEALGITKGEDKPLNIRLSFDLAPVEIGSATRIITADPVRVGGPHPALSAAPDDTGDTDSEDESAA